MTAFEIMDLCIARGGAITNVDFEVAEDVLELFVMASYDLISSEPTGNDKHPILYKITDKGRAFHAKLLAERAATVVEEENDS